MTSPTTHPIDAKQVFKKCGTCSQTFGHILNREFGHPNEMEERALDPMAGGIMNTGNQCGMLWGAALATGAEAYRQHKGDPDEAMAVAITASQNLVNSFLDQTSTVNCREITGFNLNNFFELIGFGLKTMIGGMEKSLCFNLAENWAPEAIRSAKEGLSSEQNNLTHRPASCASEVAKRMGASEEEMVAVSGFAGGLGLSGNACGAVSAALWMKALSYCKENPGKNPPFLNNPEGKKLLNAFYEETNSEILCSKIAGRKFFTIDDHSEYLKAGGCEKVIEVLATS